MNPFRKMSDHSTVNHLGNFWHPFFIMSDTATVTHSFSLEEPWSQVRALSDTSAVPTHDPFHVMSDFNHYLPLIVWCSRLSMWISLSVHSVYSPTLPLFLYVDRLMSLALYNKMYLLLVQLKIQFIRIPLLHQFDLCCIDIVFCIPVNINSDVLSTVQRGCQWQRNVLLCFRNQCVPPAKGSLS